VRAQNIAAAGVGISEKCDFNAPQKIAARDGKGAAGRTSERQSHTRLAL
jgi:hypothetical protein